MLRKISLIAAAAVALGTAALAPTAASAHWHGGGWHGGGWHGGWHHGWHRPFYGPRVFVGGPVYSYGYGGCYVRRVVPTPWGPRWRWINRCY
ncbi:hypothetical protein ACVIJ6_006376 [Bradyrhizobium sp. USDA 4369]